MRIANVKKKEAEREGGGYYTQLMRISCERKEGRKERR